VSGQLHASAALPPGNELPIPMGQEVRWAPDLGLTLRKRKIYCILWEWNADQSSNPEPIRYTDSSVVASAAVTDITETSESVDAFLSRIAPVLCFHGMHIC
jgi:hypothetical protein